MARRKSKFMDQDSDSESDSGDSAVDDQHDPNDDLIPRHAQGYQRGKKRTREQLKEDATYGVWAQQQASDEDDSTTARRRGLSSTASSRTRKQKDYLAGQSFVAAGSATSDALANKGEPTIDNLAASTNLAIQESKSDEEDVAMEMNSSDSDDSQHDAEDDDAEDEGVEEDDRADLAPIPGLGPTTTVEPTAVQDVEAPGDSLGFAPRGLGSARRGGGGGGIGARAGIGGRGGSAAGARGGIGSMSMFAAATAASDSNAGSVSQQKSAPSSGASTPRPGLGSMSSNLSARPSRGGIGSKGASTSLVDSLRAELNQPRPSSTTDSVPSSSAASPAPAAAPTRQPPAQVPHDLPPQRASASTSTSTEPAPRRSFLPAAPPVNKPKPKPLSRSESLHFNSLRSTNSVGLKLLEKMGWSAESGVGLGKDGTGIVVPLGEGQKVREKGAGIKSGERTKASWEEEARRKGVSVKELMGTKEDEDEAGEGRRDKGKQKRDKHREAWAGDEGAGAGSGKARNKKRERIKTEFKTYEEILAENGEDGTAERPRELLVDLSGNALPDQSLTSSLPAFGAGSADPTRLPELRHNLVLLTSTLSSHLRALAKEGSNVITRRKYLLAEEERVRVGVEKQEKKMTQLRQVLEVVQRVKDKENEVRELMSMVSISGQDADAESVELLLLKFEDEFDQLLGQYREEYEEMRLDQVVVGAITPICRRIFQSWDPLAQPSLCVAPLKRYRKLFLIDKHLAPSTATGSTSVDVYGSGRDRDLEGDMSERRRHKVESEREMTAFESFMWTIWLPKIRSAINNDWSPSDPTRAVTLFSTWSALLPSFLSSNILDQLVLPKLSTAISEWSPSAYKRGQAPGLHTIVFPWLEVAGQERMDGLLDECKRRVRSWVKSGWKAKEGVPQGLEVWKDAFAKSDWDTLLLQHVLPSLGSLLRDKLVINPRAQELSPIESVLAWRPLMTDRMTSQLLESEFFPKWGHALWVWLKSDHVNLEQVAEWYKWWKGYFPPDVVELKGVERGFRKGLDLMNQAMALGEDVKYRLKEPNFAPKQSASSSSSRNKPSGSTPSSTKSAAPGPVATEISFRSIVEDMCSGANLLFLSTGRTTARGRNLYRVSKNVDGKGGVLCYLEDDVVWLVVGKAGGEGDAEPVGIEDMIRRAKGTAK